MTEAAVVAATEQVKGQMSLPARYENKQKLLPLISLFSFS